MIVSGALSVGKSDTLRSMRASLGDVVGDVATLESDQFYMMIDPHWTCPADHVDRYYAVSGWLVRETAIGFLRRGFDWVAIASNGLWQEAQAREFVEPIRAEDVDVHHVTLDPGDDVVRRRVEARARANGLPSDEQRTVEALDLLGKVRSHLGSWTHVVDNGALTPSATALAIYGAVASGQGRLLA